MENEKEWTIAVNTGKFILLVLGLLADVVLMVTNTIEWEAGGPILSGIVFYAIGNGVNVSKGEGVRSVFEVKPVEE